MLNIQRCLYGIFYGSMESGAADKEISQENVSVLTGHEAPVAATSINKMRDDLVMDDGWVYIEEAEESISGRSSPVMVQNYDIEECSSTTSSESSSVHSTSSRKVPYQQSESFHRAKFLSSKRAHLEQKLFEDVPSNEKSKDEDVHLKQSYSTNSISATKLKRFSAAVHFAAETKIKQRSKKSGKLSSGRNNDRKCNNQN